MDLSVCDILLLVCHFTFFNQTVPLKAIEFWISNLTFYSMGRGAVRPTLPWFLHALYLKYL